MLCEYILTLSLMMRFFLMIPPAQFSKLLIACKHGDINEVKTVLEADPDLLQATGGSRQLTPLHQAALSGHLPVVTYLVDQGANITAKDGKGSVPALYALERKHLPVVQYLAHKKKEQDVISSSKELVSELGPFTGLIVWTASIISSRLIVNIVLPSHI